MLLHLKRASPVPPAGILKLAVVGARFSSSLGEKYIVGGDRASIPANVLRIVYEYSGLLCHFKDRSAAWFLPCHHPSSGQGPFILTVVLNQEGLALVYHDGRCPDVKSTLLTIARLPWRLR